MSISTAIRWLLCTTLLLYFSLYLLFTLWLDPEWMPFINRTIPPRLRINPDGPLVLRDDFFESKQLAGGVLTKVVWAGRVHESREADGASGGKVGIKLDRSFLQVGVSG